MILYLAEAMTKAEAIDEAARSRLVAILFERNDPVDSIVTAFIKRVRAQGVRVSGLTQEPGAGEDEVFMRDLDTGETFAIMQDLGAAAEGCAVDPAQIAIGAQRLDAARARRPDLLIVNRFGRLEAEGGGMRAEIAAAIAEGLALLIAVPTRFLDAWNEFAGGLDTQAPPTEAALAAWWDGIAPLQSDAST